MESTINIDHFKYDAQFEKCKDTAYLDSCPYNVSNIFDMYIIPYDENLAISRNTTSGIEMEWLPDWRSLSNNPGGN